MDLGDSTWGNGWNSNNGGYYGKLVGIEQEMRRPTARDAEGSTCIESFPDTSSLHVSFLRYQSCGEISRPRVGSISGPFLERSRVSRPRLRIQVPPRSIRHLGVSHQWPISVSLNAQRRRSTIMPSCELVAKLSSEEETSTSERSVLTNT